MVELESLAEKIFSLLKGNGLKIKIYDAEGMESVDPTVGRRFFVASPNIMITINEETGNIEFSKGSSTSEDPKVEDLQKNVRKIGNEYLLNFSIREFGKANKKRDVKPSDFAYQVKGQGAMNEGFQTNSLMLSKVYHELDYAAGMTAEALADNIPGADLNEVQKALNALLDDDKVEILSYLGKNPVYGKTMVEAMAETFKPGLPGIPNTSGTKPDFKKGLPAKNTNLPPSLRDKKFDKSTAENIPFKDVNMNEDNNDPKRVMPSQRNEPKYKKHDAEDVKHRDVRPFRSPSEKKRSRFDTGDVEDIEWKSAPGSLKESLSKMFGSSRVSQQTLENVRILVKHKTPVDENIRGSRTRHIGAIFLECEGERFRFPHNYLPGARAMAQHMAHGGTMTDKVGAYIAESTGNLLKLQSFNRYVTTNKLINEDSSGIVETVKENIETIRTELKKLTGVKTYETVKARLETFEREQLSEDDTSQLKELFTIRRFDEKFEEVLPIVKQLVQEKDTYHKRIEEAAGNIILLRRESINTTPMFEFAGENARLGFKLNELALRIVENEELAGFVNKIGNKLCKEGIVNEFEKAVMKQILENVQVTEFKKTPMEIKESVNLDSFFDKYTMNFF